MSTRSLSDYFALAEPWADYLAGVEDLRDFWHAVDARVRLPQDLPPPGALAGRVHFLAIAEDWCGDAVNTMPIIAALAAHLGVDLRVIARDAYPDLIDQYLTDGRSRSIPVVIALDADFQEIGWWGPRPTELQAWRMGPAKELHKDEAIKESRRWYARDRGQSTVREVLALVSDELAAVSEPAQSA